MCFTVLSFLPQVSADLRKHMLGQTSLISILNQPLQSPSGVNAIHAAWSESSSKLSSLYQTYSTLVQEEAVIAKASRITKRKELEKKQQDSQAAAEAAMEQLKEAHRIQHDTLATQIASLGSDV